MAPISCGQALSREGKFAAEIVPLKAGITVWEATGGKLRSPTLNASLAEAMALTGDLNNALRLINEQIVQIERPGWEERRDGEVSPRRTRIVDRLGVVRTRVTPR